MADGAKARVESIKRDEWSRRRARLLLIIIIIVEYLLARIYDVAVRVDFDCFFQI